VRGNEFSACGSDCLYLEGGEGDTWDDVEVSKNKMMQCGGYGIDITGDGTIVENNRLTSIQSYGVYLIGDRAEVVGNRFNLIGHEAVYLEEGDDALIQSNRFDNISGSAVYLSGNRATVTKNKMTNIAFAEAIEFDGDDGEISRNTIKSSEESGMEVVCDDGNSACVDGIVIERNKLTDVGSNDYWGIYVDTYAGAGGVNIQRNNLRNIGYIGIQYEADPGSGSATIEGNSVRTAGTGGETFFTEGQDCFWFGDADLDSSVIDRNKARDCGGHGFSLAGTGHKLTNNKIKNVGDSGVNVDSSAVDIEITGNKISGAAKNGVEIESGATGTSVQGNKIKNNRLDICNEGAGSSSVGGNKPSGKITLESELCANL